MAPGCHDNGYVSALNSFITSGQKEKLILLPGYAEMAAGIDKLGIPSLPIPDLFLPEKINLFSDRSRTPSPPTSPPPPGLVHPGSLAITKPTIIPQNVKDSYYTPVRRGSDPGIFNRAVIEGGVSYKSAVQGKVLGSGDGFAKPAVSSTKGSPTPSQIDSSDAAIMGGGGHGAPSRRINPKIVEFIQFRFRHGNETDDAHAAFVFRCNCSPFGNVSDISGLQKDPV